MSAAEQFARIVSLVAELSRRERRGEDAPAIHELAERVRTAAGSSSPIVRIPYDEAYAEGFEDMPRRVPDLTKLERMIGFRPSTPLATIIADVLAHVRSRTEVLV